MNVVFIEGSNTAAMSRTTLGSAQYLSNLPYIAFAIKSSNSSEFHDPLNKTSQIVKRNFKNK
jgi:hypothetical protein